MNVQTLTQAGAIGRSVEHVCVSLARSGEFVLGANAPVPARLFCD